MSFRDVEFTRNRQVIHDLLLRAKRFHCSINATVELDVTDLLARIEAERAAGRDIRLVSFLHRRRASCVPSWITCGGSSTRTSLRGRGIARRRTRPSDRGRDPERPISFHLLALAL